MTRIHNPVTASAVLALLAGLAAPVGAQEGQATQEPPATSSEQPMGAPVEPATDMDQQGGSEGLYSLRVKEVEGKTVANVNGDKLGDVEEVVRGADDGRLYVVVSVGGFLGIGDKQVALPVDDLQLSEDQLVMTTNMDEDTLKEQAASFQEDQYQQITEDVTLAEAGGAKAGGGGAEELPAFATLDRDGDGVISRAEAREAAALESNWEQADQDQDGQLSESEFSAFEQSQSREQPGMQPGGMQQHDRTRDTESMQQAPMQQSPEGTSPAPRAQ